MLTYSVFPGFAVDGVNVALCNVVSAFSPNGCFGILFGSIFSDMVLLIFRSMLLFLKMEKVYYSTKGYWKGYAAIEKLSREAGVSERDAKEWLGKQALWQIYLPFPEYIPRPRWTVSKPNQVHQADLLFLPHDTIWGRVYRYALVVIDVASRYKDAEALRTKESGEISKCFSKIYSRRLSWPGVLMVDPGREFMGNVSKLMEKHGVSIQRGQAGNHRSQAFVERANKTLSERLFSFQYAQEMVHSMHSYSLSNSSVYYYLSSTASGLYIVYHLHVLHYSSPFPNSSRSICKH